MLLRHLSVCIAVVALAFLSGYAVGQSKLPTDTKGQSVERLRSLDLTPEIQTVAGHELRLSRVTLLPGGVVTQHNHVGRPTVSYVLQGTVTYHQEGKPDLVMNPGDGLADGKATTHWLENRGTVPAVWVAAGIQKIQ
jgi:quercetin dioxygenase-like cupin family protein